MAECILCGFFERLRCAGRPCSQLFALRYAALGNNPYKDTNCATHLSSTEAEKIFTSIFYFLISSVKWGFGEKFGRLGRIFFKNFFIFDVETAKNEGFQERKYPERNEIKIESGQVCDLIHARTRKPYYLR